ncbi:hypothetical protein C9374_008935 [Naegleria lovaniensis]|uniref:EF-hand domain-containing protein n=1 Tax=Naegleria lovaniensis TaxID=51637 RepID=A0AA88GIS5_NAELO|nr:uncharacterized protein C9374_008935 [Naegleria lovaniensis]KAG2377850.1 hypothetical protein C9374_008935 [Naegleria lovaniensis]
MNNYHNLIVIGDKSSGKTRLIDSIVFDPNRGDSGELPSVLPPQEFSFPLKNQEITFNFIDTDSSKSIETIFSTVPLLSSELIIFVIETNNSQAVQRFHDEWLPYIVRSKKMLYIIQSKVDTVETIESFNCSEVEKYVRFQGVFEYSSKTRENIEVLLFNLSKLFFFSADYLYNFSEERLTSQCHKALRRIFWLIDEHNSGQIQVENLKSLLGVSEEDQVSFDEDEKTMSLESFLGFMVTLILTRHEHLVWNMVQKFNYNDRLVLDIDDFISEASPDISHEDVITLSEEGKQVLSHIFRRFDKDNDGLLDEEDIDEAFSLTSIHSLLFEWGYSEIDKLIEIKKKRLFRQTSSDYPSVLHCYVFGASNCGKTSILRHFIGKKPLNGDVHIKSVQYSVVDRINLQNKEYHLIITEFEDKEIPVVLKSEEIMGKCDVALLLFDGNDRYSFSFLEHIQRGLDPSIPCVYMLTKHDLEIVEQENMGDVTPKQFCEALSLIWPPYLCSLVSSQGLNNIKTLFSDLLEVALNPEDSGCLPKWSMCDIDEINDNQVDDDSDGGDLYKKESLVKRTLKVIGVVSGFGLITFAIIRWLKKSKD